MLTQELTQLIVILRSLINLPEDEAIKATNLFKIYALERGNFFVRAGDVPKTIGFVNSGILRLYYVDRDGNEYTKSFCAENSFVAACFLPRHHSCNLEPNSCPIEIALTYVNELPQAPV